MSSESEYLNETEFFDVSSPTVRAFVATEGRSSPEDRGAQAEDQQALAVRLYNRVRDGWLYDAYRYHTLREHMRASEIMTRDRGHCLDKAIILITCYRAVGLPARLHLAKVRNHIAAERIIEKFGTNELTPHGFVEVFLNDKWVACTPAFNKSLCDRIGVAPLEFDGENDSVFQAYNNDSQFIEYLDDYGTFADFPYEFVMETMDEHYPQFRAIRDASPVFRL